ncbi:MAG: polyprenol phosphomannose-dependent alpha 1,6 mannosyltransferase MptB [Candidatus Omnitrophica bacterium]|nr:polyprenol phosphomannose-dependent alpha 1,6 mannosyltransferase MptB [Candidatus Omnitrophota bacterium]
MRPIRYIYYAVAVMALLLIVWAKHVAGETNLPPLKPFVRYTALAVLLNLGAAYYFLCRKVGLSERGWSLKVWFLFALSAVPSLLVFPVFSGDIIEYLIRGRIWVIYGANPYIHYPAEYPQDMLYPYSAWKDYSDAYGPIFLVIKSLPALIFRDSITGMIFTMKLINLCFLALATLFVYKLAGKSRVSPVRAAALFALCPLTVCLTAIDGQNDIIMGTWLILAVYCILREKVFVGYVFWLLAFLTKYTAILPLPMLLLYTFKIQRARQDALPVGLMVKLLLMLLGLGILIFLPFWNGAQTFGALTALQDRFYTNTIPYAVVMALGKAGLTVSENLARKVFLASYIVAYGVLWVRLALKPFISAESFFRTLALVFLLFYVSLTSPFIYNYLFWALPWIVLSRWPLDIELILIYSLAGVLSFYKRINFLLLAGVASYILLWMRFRRALKTP